MVSFHELSSQKKMSKSIYLPGEKDVSAVKARISPNPNLFCKLCLTVEVAVFG